MDFIEFDSFTPSNDAGNLPQPQPSLSLPISTNLEQFSKKLSSFSLSRNFAKVKTTLDAEKKNSPDDQNRHEVNAMDDYVQKSLTLLKANKEDDDDNHGGGGDGDNLASSNQQTKGNNADLLAPRLARVLNDTLSDSTLREIFNTIEEDVAGRKLEPTSYYQNLTEPGFVGTITRKKLKGRIEEDLIKSQTLVLKEYQPIVRRLKIAESRLKKLNQLNREVNERISKNLLSSTDFNEKAMLLTREKNMVGVKQELLTAFKNKFTLTEYEEFILVSGELNDEFFQTLDKAEAIIENCSVLLSEDNPQLGLKIMSKVNHVINRAIERIVGYCSKTLDNFYSLNSRSRLATLHECFRYLKPKLNYFATVVDKFGESRSKVLLEDFYHQTLETPDEGSSNNGSSSSRPSQGRRRSSARTTSSVSSVVDVRPVYMSAHDPVRFVGDFLAYIHSLAVNEYEIIRNIFTMGDDNDREFDQVIGDLTNKILKNLSRPIKSKIEQIISAETKLTTISQIFNLVELYSHMFAKQLQESDNLVDTMKQLVKSCQNRFFNIVSNKLATVQSSNSAKLELNLDLQPPEWIISFYSEVLHMIDQVTTDTILNLPREDHEQFLKLVINRPIEIFSEHVRNNKIFSDKRDVLILKFNFLDLIQAKIMPISLLSEKVIEINEMNLDLTAQLTQCELANILKSSGLYDYYNIVNMICPFTDDFFEVSIYQPMTENKLYNVENLHKVNDEIHQYLPNAMIELQQALLRLNSPVTVNEVINNAFTQFVKFYKNLNLINLEYLQFSFSWSDQELATLLGIESSYISDYSESMSL
ncbi:uncharacterized protein LODBEIA_P01480 [Lodderomyces beijingensis]|uniref:Conserved oligomeric Golgi complex subunit 6 n=1 Tax=Lodderomyces beijingensis TaxID=1775926 RepID=A0ABP0ZCK6_9ASCO